MSSTPQPLISVPGQDGKAHTPTLEPAPISPWKKVQTRPPMPSPTTHHPKPSWCRTPLPPPQLPAPSPSWNGHLAAVCTSRTGPRGRTPPRPVSPSAEGVGLGNPVISIFTVELSHRPATAFESLATSEVGGGRGQRFRTVLQQQQQSFLHHHSTATLRTVDMPT